jgi:hypothetical protein
MCRELELLMTSPTTPPYRERLRDRRPRGSHEIARQARRAEERRLHGHRQ